MLEMSGTGPIVTVSPRDYDAVLFDLDGVLTQTASVHAAAWKRLFDDFLQKRAAETGEEFVPFDIDADYPRYVDGKPRYDGVADFLESRGVRLPLGEPGDAPDRETVYGLGKLKDSYFTQHLQQHGVEPYEPSVELVHSLRGEDVRTAVVSSSNNCAAVLDAVGIADLFDVRVDGVDITTLGLKGKPAPDAFLEATRRLRVEPARAVVVEDAISGVAAARAGEFGLVIGVDRVAQSQALREAGANVVVTSLDQVQIATEPPSAWSLVYEEFHAAREGMREALCALGNGYFESRGAAAWAQADGVHYPGTYVAGAYNRVQTSIAGRTVENEDLVNFPNWLALGFRIGDGGWFDERSVKILSYRQELDLRHGSLLKSLSFEDSHGRRSTLRERRLVSMADMHLGALELTLVAENWSGTVTIRSAVDGRVVNAGAALYREFNNRHLEPLESMAAGEDTLCLGVQTSQSKLQVAQAVRTRVFRDGERQTPTRRLIEEPGYIAHEFEVELNRGNTLVLEKVLALHTSRDHAVSESGIAARKSITRAGSYDELLNAHVLSWKHIWRRFGIHVRPATSRFNLNVPMLLRLNILHLLQAASLNSIGLDVGVPPRGWTGEAYQGHIFWDELFIFPFLTLRTPEITRSLLMYRYRRLREARAAAKSAGFEGAMFPWQSGSDGQEETQELNLNHRSRRWVPDNSWLQRHVGSAIAYNVWNYFQITYDTEFLQFYGAELILEIARFWSSAAQLNERSGRYEIHGVMGPDEFHEGYPDAPAPGLRNNAYTNIMASWVLCRAIDVLDVLPETRRAELMRSLNLTEDDPERWRDISRRMFVPFHGNGIISQFEGYEQLAELDWNSYRLRYGNIQRLDLILEAEGDSSNRYKIGKQADVLMLFYLFSADELGALFKRLGYPFEYDTIPRNVDYYGCRSTHGSTLSRVVHAWVLARSDRPRAMKYFAEALQSDVGDIQQGTTAEGIHLGAMAGSVDLVQRVTTGIEVSRDVLRLNPQLPRELERIDMRVRYRGHALDLRITKHALTVRGRERGPAPINLALRDEVVEFDGNGTRVFKLANAEAPASRKSGTG
jgi:beta-phosphoglucomutase family hydrolase